jgi:hypothetical protein
MPVFQEGYESGALALGDKEVIYAYLGDKQVYPSAIGGDDGFEYKKDVLQRIYARELYQAPSPPTITEIRWLWSDVFYKDFIEEHTVDVHSLAGMYAYGLFSNSDPVTSTLLSTSQPFFLSHYDVMDMFIVSVPMRFLLVNASGTAWREAGSLYETTDNGKYKMSPFVSATDSITFLPNCYASPSRKVTLKGHTCADYSPIGLTGDERDEWLNGTLILTFGDTVTAMFTGQFVIVASVTPTINSRIYYPNIGLVRVRDPDPEYQNLV